MICRFIEPPKKDNGFWFLRKRQTNGLSLLSQRLVSSAIQLRLYAWRVFWGCLLRRLAAAETLVVDLFLRPHVLAARSAGAGVAAAVTRGARVRMVFVALVVCRASVVLLDHIITSPAV